MIELSDLVHWLTLVTGVVQLLCACALGALVGCAWRATRDLLVAVRVLQQGLSTLAVVLGAQLNPDTEPPPAAQPPAEHPSIKHLWWRPRE